MGKHLILEHLDVFLTPIKHLIEKLEANKVDKSELNEVLDSKIDKDDLDEAISSLVNSAPETLDTLGELATALQENEDVVETLNKSITDKVSKTELTDATSIKMNKLNPNGTGSFSLNRKADSVVGLHSVAMGDSPEASGDYSHAEGRLTLAASDYQHVQGKYNISDNEEKYAHIVGNGESDTARANAHTLDWDGNAWFAGTIKVGGTGQDDETAAEIATKDYVDALRDQLTADDIATPQKYGAKGDGVTDDTAAIQAAIDNNKVVKIPEGKYLISSTITIPQDRYVFGEGNVQQAVGRSTLYTTANICMIKFTSHRSSIENLVLEHDSSNTSNIIEFGNCHYLTLQNIAFNHGSTQCEATGINFESDEDQWCGYIKLKNVTMSLYKHSLYGRCTLMSVEDCILNRASDVNLHLGGEVYSFTGCDISGTGTALEYTGTYEISFNGCYFEGYMLHNAFILSDKKASLNLEGSKVYYANNTIAIGTNVNIFEFTDQNQMNQIYNFGNGTHSSTNSVVNSNFSNGIYNWNQNYNWEAKGKEYAQITSGLPEGFNSGLLLTDNIYANVGQEGYIRAQLFSPIGKLSKGQYTFGVWVKNGTDFVDGSVDIDFYIANSIYSSATHVSRMRKRVVFSDWTLWMTVFEIPEEYAENEWLVYMTCAGVKETYVTGVAVHKGIYYETPNGNSVSEKIVCTDAILLADGNGDFYNVNDELVEINSMVEATMEYIDGQVATVATQIGELNSKVGDTFVSEQINTAIDDSILTTEEIDEICNAEPCSVNTASVFKGNYVPLVTPTDFAWQDNPISGNVFTNYNGDYKYSIDVSDYEPEVTGTTYYVDCINGLNSNDGLTANTPIRNMEVAYNKSDCSCIVLASGHYDMIRNLGHITINKTLSIKAASNATVYITTHSPLSNASEYSTGVYSSPRGNNSRVLDMKYKNIYGDFVEYTKLTSVDEVVATAGSWALIDGMFYVHTLDERVLDTDMLFLAKENNLKASGDITLYLENLNVIGGHSPLHVCSASTEDHTHVFAKNCNFRYSGSIDNDVVMLQGVELSFMQDCSAMYGQKDGFNYHASNGIIPHSVEIRCVGAVCGNTEDSNDQGSTTHDGGSAIRVQCTYFRNQGSNVADASEGTESWNIGCIAYEPLAVNEGQRANFYAYEGVKMWIDSCVGFGGHYNLYATDANSIYVRNNRFDGLLKLESQTILYY